MNKRKATAMTPRTTSQIAFPADEVVLSPTQTQTAFITPVCASDGSRAWYMKRQMIPAPMNEIAIGRKMSDLAAFSALARSASTATARPNTVARVTTTTTHQRLLNSVPRSTEKTAHENTNTPIPIAPTEDGPRSKSWPVRRPETNPTTTPTPTMTTASQKS